MTGPGLILAAECRVRNQEREHGGGSDSRKSGKNPARIG
jgi:hypothetical protein